VSIFITFEGVEGSGKTTQLKRLGEHLRATGCTVVETREPGGTPAGVAIRSLLLSDPPIALAPAAELLLYLADRAQHVAERIQPALAAGEIVLCDRFSDSTIAYQGFARGLDLERVRDVDAYARAGLVPDLTFLLDVDPSIGLRRVQTRAGASDRFEAAPLAFHERVRRGLRELAAAAPERVRVVDATAPVDEVARRIAAEADRILGAR